MRLQWKELRDSLHKKYVQYDKESFEVLLSRALNRLVKSGDAKKDDKSHQEVYYYIPKRRQKKVIDEISKRFLYKKVDEFWERFSLEQKKRMAKDLAHSQMMIIQGQKIFFKEMLTIFGGWANDSIGELNDPLKQKNLNYTDEEKIKLNNELTKLNSQCNKIENAMAVEDKYLVDNFNSLVKLSFDFLNYVVDPLYDGNGQKAIQDLMRKAVEEQKNKNKP